MGLHERFHASAQRSGEHAECLPLVLRERHAHRGLLLVVELGQRRFVAIIA
jgi:hypothetical protein